MEFCDNLDQLLQAYFRNFSFEKLVKPWKAFTASWSPEIIARNLGINSSFVHGDYCYVLVRLSRFRDNVSLSRLPNNVRLDETVAEEIDNIIVGDAHSVLMFIQKFGTHYIDSFVTGNSLYQVREKLVMYVFYVSVNISLQINKFINTNLYNKFFKILVAAG